MSETDTSPGSAGVPEGAHTAERTAATPTSPPAETPVPVTPDDDGTVRFGRGPVGAPQLTRRGRVRKWDRPPPPHDWRWYVGNLGKTLIAVGLLMFAFVGYQLYGTGIETAAAQRGLEDEFEELLAQADPVEAPDFESSGSTTEVLPGDVVVPVEAGSDESGGDASDTSDDSVVAPPVESPPPAEAVVPVEEQNLPALEDGDALARIEIPRIGVDDIVVAGVETSDLKRGPGHFPDTPLPGQLGNAAIAGHRTTYGQPFRNVDELEPGDEIRVTTLSGVYVYRVTGQQIVSPSEYQVVATTDPTRANLTLTSCHPVFTARERIVIFSELAYTESAPVGEPVLNYGRPPEPVSAPPDATDAGADDGSNAATEGGDDPTLEAAPTPESTGEVTGALADDEPSTIDQLGTEAVNSGIADAFSESWFSDPAANPQVGLWGVALGSVALGAYFVSRKLRRDWAGLLVGIVPFVVVLYFFFQNVNRLLPPNL